MIEIWYLGERGTYSYDVAERFKKDRNFTKATFRGFDTITSICTTRPKEKSRVYRILPLENTSSGDIYETYEMLHKYPLPIVGIYTLFIEHVLLGIQGSCVQEIKEAYSHPQALAQVTQYLRMHEMHALPMQSTAHAASYISDKNDRTKGAIGSYIHAELFDNIEVVDRNISNHHENYTRFVILEETQLEREQSSFSNTHTIFKSSLHNIEHQHHHTYSIFLIFQLFDDQSGRLMDVLEIIKKYKINMTSIKSRPLLGKSFEYSFIVEGVYDDSLTETFFEEMNHSTSTSIIHVLENKERDSTK